jgi:hypothetical protein
MEQKVEKMPRLVQHVLLFILTVKAEVTFPLHSSGLSGRRLSWRVRGKYLYMYM